MVNKTQYVYTKKFAKYSKGIRQPGELVHSDYLDMTDEKRLRRFLDHGFIRPATQRDLAKLR